MDVKTAIEIGDAAALRRLLADVPARADELIRGEKTAASLRIRSTMSQICDSKAGCKLAESFHCWKC